MRCGIEQIFMPQLVVAMQIMHICFRKYMTTPIFTSRLLGEKS